MHIVTRKIGETLLVGDNIKVTVLCINLNEIKIGIEAPEDTQVQVEKVVKTVIDEVA